MLYFGPRLATPFSIIRQSVQQIFCQSFVFDGTNLYTPCTSSAAQVLRYRSLDPSRSSSKSFNSPKLLEQICLISPLVKGKFPSEYRSKLKPINWDILSLSSLGVVIRSSSKRYEGDFLLIKWYVQTSELNLFWMFGRNYIKEAFWAYSGLFLFVCARLTHLFYEHLLFAILWVPSQIITKQEHFVLLVLRSFLIPSFSFALRW